MAISKSTPYVRYKKDFTSSLHLGTIHIESEYLDRTQKTTIESIHGMTWHNKVVNENKELNLLSDTQLELTDLEKQYWNTGEKRVSVDEIHTLEEVEPNEDGTYTYTVNSMEGEYIEIYNGINNITSTSDGLDGQFEIVYDTTEEDVNGNIALDQVVPQYEITDSGVGAITSAKSTGLTLVNHITEPSKEEVVAIEQQKGQYFTIDNTVQGNIKSAILKGMTLVNLVKQSSATPMYMTKTPITNGYQYTQQYNAGSMTATRIQWDNGNGSELFKPLTKYYIQCEIKVNKYREFAVLSNGTGGVGYSDTLQENSTNSIKAVFTTSSKCTLIYFYVYPPQNADFASYEGDTFEITNLIIMEYQEGMENWDIPYFEGMKSVQMPVLTTNGGNLIPPFTEWSCLSGSISDYSITDKRVEISLSRWNMGVSITKQLKPNTTYTVGWDEASMVTFNFSGTDKSGDIPPFRTFTTGDTGIVTFTLKNSMSSGTFIVDGFRISEGNSDLGYEPYKSNILTVNEEVELRGVGDIQDTLDCLTGEVVQSIYNLQLTGDENWGQSGFINDGYFVAYTTFTSNLSIANSKLICDKLNYDSSISVTDTKTEGINIVGDSSLRISLSKTKIATLNDFINWIRQEQPVINFVAKEKSIKTVDLTVQNQDGGTIPHIQTQQGITHVSTSSDGLTPVVEMSCSYDTIIKPNTTYTIKLDRPIVSDTMNLQVDLGGTMMMLDADVNAFTIKTPSTLSHSQLRLSGTGNTIKEIMVLEGNRVNDKIEYFEGMENVENPILVVSNCQYVFGKGGRK